MAQFLIGTVDTTVLGYGNAFLIAERHHSELAVTEYPVEEGGNFVDHAYSLPREVWLEFALSDLINIYEGDTPSVIWQKILSMQDNRTLCDVVTAVGQYSQMLLRVGDEERRVEGNRDGSVVVSFRQVQFAGSIPAVILGPETSDYPPVRDLGTVSPVPYTGE